MNNLKNIVLISCMIAFTTTGCTTGAFLLGSATAVVVMKKMND
jgi:hypothetical protein